MTFNGGKRKDNFKETLKALTEEGTRLINLTKRLPTNVSMYESVFNGARGEG